MAGKKSPREDSAPEPAAASAAVVVGAGPAGVRVVREILRHDPGRAVVLFGAEPWAPYDRVKLSTFLAGENSFESLSLPVPRNPTLTVSYHTPVLAIDRERRCVRTAYGRTQCYDYLVLATGARPHAPELPGIGLREVYTFRDLKDAERLLARRVRSRHTVVLGGGLLGLEAARAMRRFNTRVTVIDHNPRLLFKHLDAGAALLVKQQVESFGIRVILSDGISRVLGEGALRAVQLRGGDVLECDTLIVATGIRPNIDLARQAGLRIGRGIAVNDAMQTSDPRVYAVGECAEHRGKIYGLAAPGLEQAAVAARHITGGHTRYLGSVQAARLKVAGCTVISLGEVEARRVGHGEAIYRDDSGCYRKLVLYRGRLVGAMAVGEWLDFGRVQDAVNRRRRLWPWQARRFRLRGWPWARDEAQGVAGWPASAVVCNCTGVTRGQLTAALRRGPSDLSRETGAGTVCGSCRPLLADLLGAAAALSPTQSYRSLIGLSVLGLTAVGLILSLPAIPYNPSVQVAWEWGDLWRNGLYKQWSGFTLLGVSAIALTLSMRKRVRGFSSGDFGAWRVFHVIVGLATIIVLIVHTGLRLGEHLNQYLMLSFAGLLLTGALAALVQGLEHRIARHVVRPVRGATFWLHLLVFWPFPALLGLHILKTYYF